MKILLLHSGRHVPSARFRVLPYVRHLRAAGHRCMVAGSFPQKYDYFRVIGFRPSQWLKRIVRWVHWLLACAVRFDVILIEREVFDSDGCSFEERFRRVTGRLVLDVDDAIFLKHGKKFEQIARMSDLVIVGNRFLQQHTARLNPRTTVIPTSVDLTLYAEAKPQESHPERVIVGWTGTTANLDVFELIARPLRRLARRLEFELRIIAPDISALQRIDLAGVTVRHVPWSIRDDVAQLSRFDIGLMPLSTDREWDRYKCGFKLIQYMAGGIPGVASPVGVNADIVKHGVDGYLAETDEQWESALLELAGDGDLRRRIGAAARKKVAAHYSIEASFPKLEAALKANICDR